MFFLYYVVLIRALQSDQFPMNTPLYILTFFDLNVRKLEKICSLEGFSPSFKDIKWKN